MKPISASLDHLIHLPQQPAAAMHPAVIMLHGRGADEEDLFGLGQYLDQRMLVLSPRAPHPFPYGGGYTWYDVGQVGTPEPAMFQTSYEGLSRFVDEAIAHYPIDPGQVYLFGFSMGTVMSFALSLTRPELFRGVVAHSGYVPEGTHLTLQWQRLSRLEYFIAHGTQDPVIPLAFAHRARELFSTSNATVEYKEYPIGHEMSEEGLHDSAAFLRRLLPPLQE